MIGNITQPNSSPLSLRNPNIYIMDIRNYTWVDSFDPTIMGTKTNSSAIQPSSLINNLNKELVTMKIVIGSFGAILCVVIIIVCGFLIYRWNAKKKEQSPTNIPTAPVTSIEHNDQDDKEQYLSEVMI
ncbi:912_t:CDS:1 [Funneliformis mosseae]|uniref:912_t:CDS:1 n=1 Tax=Funneliformis mosseae TaxID=27381 RepID=A0A9N9CL35_FUNMO|nr:912_t:CDS:1 [Funneliformis mosseae]